jgi:TolB-like protein
MKNTFATTVFFLFFFSFSFVNAQRGILDNVANTLLESEKKNSSEKRSKKNDAEMEKLYNQGMKDLASQISSDLAENNKKKVAIINFMNTKSQSTELGKFLAEEFSNLLFSRKLTIIDRSQMESLMNENKISAKGLMKPSEVARLGKLAGVQAIIIGTITLFDKKLKLAVKAIDVEQGIVVGAALGTIPRTESIDELYHSDSKSSSGSRKN